MFNLTNFILSLRNVKHFKKGAISKENFAQEAAAGGGMNDAM